MLLQTLLELPNYKNKSSSFPASFHHPLPVQSPKWMQLAGCTRSHVWCNFKGLWEIGNPVQLVSVVERCGDQRGSHRKEKKRKSTILQHWEIFQINKKKSNTSNTSKKKSNTILEKVHKMTESRS